ncbi:hypothetical protein KUTeg_008948 [Tegillarca granosa]|uniref:Uncharacterized protein n=1 Tax=Tegillarca granosa TaxID=220873 RepID=A0ABQ9FD31_TEGGR|nr:hypothetical protein KUTeg_008948 [Tegillarca granosa]
MRFITAAILMAIVICQLQEVYTVKEKNMLKSLLQREKRSCLAKYRQCEAQQCCSGLTCTRTQDRFGHSYYCL